MYKAASGPELLLASVLQTASLRSGRKVECSASRQAWQRTARERTLDFAPEACTAFSDVSSRLSPAQELFAVSACTAVARA